MKLTLFFFCLLIISCSNNEKKQNTNVQTEVASEKIIMNNEQVTNTELTYRETQDSLRTLILNSKPSKSIKSSILQELYIRGIVSQVNDKINFKIPFNLHGLDCGAPDCYSTDISFNIPTNNPVQFPEKINFNLSEHGCVDEEISINGIFELVEQSTEFVNYYSKELKSNFIIKEGMGLYYYPHQQTNSVKVERIDEMFESYEFEKENVIAPYRSTIMQIYEYQRYVKNE